MSFHGNIRTTRREGQEERRTFNEHSHDVKQCSWLFTSNTCLKPRKVPWNQCEGHSFMEEQMDSKVARLCSVNHTQGGRSGTGPRRGLPQVSRLSVHQWAYDNFNVLQLLVPNIQGFPGLSWSFCRMNMQAPLSILGSHSLPASSFLRINFLCLLEESSSLW